MTRLADSILHRTSLEVSGKNWEAWMDNHEFEDPLQGFCKLLEMHDARENKSCLNFYVHGM
jgi:hypothetical protein